MPVVVQTASLLTGDGEPSVVGPRVRDSAERALAADPTLAEAQFVHGYYRWLLQWDWAGAEREMRQAVALDPQYADATRTLGHALSQMARHGDAEAFMRRTWATEPLDPMAYGISAQVAFQARDFDHAVRLAERAIALEPTFWVGHIQLAQAEVARGHSDVALAAVTDAEQLSGRNSKAVALRGHLLAILGRVKKARALLDALDDASQHRYVPP